ncbi:hypothetical protein QJQ45_020648 [Haematococcus lacustris]|nr:hypothetical protein QJQ45_020648 [Haematococcus lacustris]
MDGGADVRDVARLGPALYNGVAKHTTAYKLLSSMGWQEGDGLGASKQGIKEHLKVRKKFDKFGMGAAEQIDKARDWTAGMWSYDKMLSGLKEVKAQHVTPVVDDSSSESDSPASSSSSDSGALLPQNTQPKVAVADRAGSPPRSTSSDDTGCNAPKASGNLGVSAADAAVARSRLASHAGRYQKRERAKAVRGYSASDMAAILGAAPAAAQAFPVAIVAAGRAPSLDSSDASDGPDSDADATASPAPTVIAAQSSPAVAAGPPPWWSGIFVRGGLVGRSSRKRAAAAGGHSKADRSSGGVGAGSSSAEAGTKEKIQIHGFREQDQENLYTQAHDGAVHGKQGLGRASAPKKVAGAHWCGTKTRLGSDSEGEGGQGSGSGSEASSGNITRDSNEEVGLSDDEVGVTVVTSKQQQAAVAGQQHQQQQLAAQSQQQQSPDQGNKAAGGSGQQTVSTGEKRKQKKAARGQQGQEAPPLHCQQQQQEGKQQSHVVSAAEEHPQSTSAVKQKRKKTAHLAEAVGSAGSTRGDAQPDSVAAKGRKKKKKEKHADGTVATLADAQPEVATQETKEEHRKDAGGTRAARQAGDQLKPGKVAWARLARHALAEAPDRCMKARKLLRKIMERQAAAAVSGQQDIARVAEPQQLQTMLAKLSKYADLRVEGKRVTLVPA